MFSLIIQTVQPIQAQIPDFIGEANRCLAGEFYQAWGLWDTVTTQPGGIPIYLQDTIDQPGDGGYHVDTNGQPLIRIDVTAAMQPGGDWRTFTLHEIEETLVDPSASTRIGPYTKECCDPVEGQVYRDWLPNFVYPSYFSGGPAPWDYLQQLTGWVPSLSPQGYLQYLNGNQWDLYRNQPQGYLFNRTDGRRAWHRR